ncbi:DUF4230 domain-containing protein [Weeksellaceae bacterium KMM 9713]|uniref:DUF4230 domain-containing protein n=1 Tax=Profundicola chukchiensis TaxID=2961959 RepID=A0A9X4MY35_9FLAO|nr:DUF4230 domain-containing protein [Profundicola chukchiensis]MDG4947003.1 DUF4230 domain-containing protein [Profundicola chukchiensis]MDG4949325.1 DUF4230 domain-containing protein [Profundicola chukchiensis]
MLGFLKHRAALWTLSFFLLVDIAYIVYNLQKNQDPTLLMVAFLILGLILGALLVIILNKDRKDAAPTLRTESSHTVMESMQKVFKIVTAEGHFNEIYDYKETSKLFKFIPSTKKALVIIKGKVHLGYDFAKAKWEIDEDNKKIKLIHFPEPELLSLDTDYEYYNIEEQFYNLFSKEDLANIQREGKNQIRIAAMKSHLPQTAAEQIELVLKELLMARDWTLENADLITESAKRLENKSLQP